MSEQKKSDKLIHGIAANGTVRCMATISTNAVAEIILRHHTSATVAVALGRLLTGTLLLGSSLKDFDRMTVQIVGRGEVEGLVAEVTNQGTIRGYAKNPHAEVPLKSDGKFDVPKIIGGGMFYVTREAGFDLGFYSEPFRGSVPLLSGEIGEDFAYYLAKSEQIPSAVLLGIMVKPDEKGSPIVSSSGGVMIQMMPDATEETISAIETAIKNAPQVTNAIESGATPVELLKNALGKIEFEVLEEKEIGFACTCSTDKALSLISSIDKVELQDMLEKDKGAVMNCHFCNETYRFNENDLVEILRNQNREQ